MSLQEEVSNHYNSLDISEAREEAVYNINEPILKEIYDLKGWINQWEGIEALIPDVMKAEEKIEALIKELI